jgi:hypothetical protein
MSVLSTAEFDRKRGRRGRQLERGKRESVLEEDDSEHLEEGRPAGRGANDPEGDKREHRPLCVARLEPPLTSDAPGRLTTVPRDEPRAPSVVGDCKDRAAGVLHEAAHGVAGLPGALRPYDGNRGVCG